MSRAREREREEFRSCCCEGGGSGSENRGNDGEGEEKEEEEEGEEEESSPPSDDGNSDEAAATAAARPAPETSPQSESPRETIPEDEEDRRSAATPASVTPASAWKETHRRAAAPSPAPDAPDAPVGLPLFSPRAASPASVILVYPVEREARRGRLVARENSVASETCEKFQHFFNVSLFFFLLPSSFSRRFSLSLSLSLSLFLSCSPLFPAFLP